jgi:hypothetical protein
MAVDDRASAKPNTAAGVGAEDLQSAEPEHEPPDDRQSLPRQFEANHEQEKHDAEFCDRRDLLDIFESERREPADLPRERAKAIGAKQNTGAKETQNRTELQAPEQRHDDARRRKKNQCFLVLLGCEGSHESA